MNIEQVIGHIRPAVRREKAYLVGGISQPQIKLNQNESPYDLPPDLKRELVEAFLDIPFNRYPDEHAGRLREALAGHLGHNPDGIIAGNGSNELTYAIGMSVVDRGVPVVLPRPMFSLYEKVVRLHDGDLVSVPPRPDLSFDAEAILEAVRSHRPALVVLTTPNNPTGLAMPIPEVESIVAETPGIVVVDEAYVEFTEEISARTVMDRYPNLVILRTMSKACGLAGLRLGYMMGRPELIREFYKARLPFMIDRLAEATALALLARPKLLAERIAQLKASCSELTEALAGLDGVEVLRSQSNFVLFKTPVEPRALMNRLAEAGVLVRDMGGYSELRGYLRVNAGTPDENKEFLTALKKTL